MIRHIASLVHVSTLTPALSRKRAREQDQPRDHWTGATNRAWQSKYGRSQKFCAKTRALTSREVARCPGTSNAKCRNTPLMKTLTRGGCPNGEPFGARSEFCRVTPNSKRFLVTFWRKQKVTRPPGRDPAPALNQREKDKSADDGPDRQSQNKASPRKPVRPSFAMHRPLVLLRNGPNQRKPKPNAT